MTSARVDATSLMEFGTAVLIALGVPNADAELAELAVSCGVPFELRPGKD